VKCLFCGEAVYVNGPDNVLRTKELNKDCPAPYWVVATDRTAVATFTGKAAEVRATSMASRNAGYSARQVEPHGHSTR
jgi:hypothetical protein